MSLLWQCHFGKAHFPPQESYDADTGRMAMFAILISDLTERADEGHFRYGWVPTWCDPSVSPM